MATIVLVRHGQARWFEADYDRLSELGADQSSTVGRTLARLGTPKLVLSGEQQRHRHTAALATAAAGWTVPVVADPAWNEFDHRQVLAANGEIPPVDPDAPEVFDRWFRDALVRWTDGENDTEYDEPFAGFTSRVDAALLRLREDLAPADTAVVFTSVGPICWSVAALLGGQTHVWLRLVPALANASVTRISGQGRRLSLSTFNEYGHLDAEMVTLR